METQRNLYFNNAFFDFVCAAADDIAIIWMKDEVNRRPAYCLDSFVASEMTRVYQGILTEFEIRDEDAESVFPCELKCRVLDLCPSFFGRGWTLFHNNEPVLPLTKEAWCELGFGLPMNSLLN